MAKVIKARGPGPRSLVFYERLPLEEIVKGSIRCRKIVTPERLLEEARIEAEQQIRDAYAAGFQRGRDEGKSEYLASVATSAEALQAAAVELLRMRGAFLESVEPQVVELALLVAERVLQRELAADREAVCRTVRRALEHLVDSANITVNVNPADLEALRAEKIHLLESFEGIRQLMIRADAGVGPGGCTVDAESVHVDARVESQFTRIADALREPSPTPPVEETREDS